MSRAAARTTPKFGYIAPRPPPAPSAFGEPAECAVQSSPGGTEVVSWPRPAVRGGTARGVDGRGAPLDQLVDQLWRPEVEAGQVRIATRRTRNEDWVDAETYVVLPSLARARLLLPAEPRAALRGSVTNHLHLRRPRAAAQRAALGALLRVGAPAPFPRLVVQAVDVDSARSLPLAEVSRAVGVDRLHASIGVRTGANRKATLQLVDDRGRSRGFAKLAWNAVSAEGILREAAALADGPVSGPARVPLVLAAGDVRGRCFVVTAPLPEGSAGIRSGVAEPTAQEIATLLPVVRRDRLCRTEQFRSLRARLHGVRRTPTNRTVLEVTSEVVERLAQAVTEVPVARRYHGDFTPWNCARDRSGTLWCWDWESSEVDAVAGMDAVYWHSAVRREAGERVGPRLLRRVVEDAGAILTAHGVPRREHALVGALAAATLTERACTLRDGSDAWAAGWVLPEELTGMMTAALQLLGPHRGPEGTP